MAGNVSLNIKSNKGTGEDNLSVSLGTTTAGNFDTDRQATEERSRRPAIPANWSHTDSVAESKTGNDASTSTKKKHYRCDHCEKLFPNPSTLKAHSVVHTKERPFKCNQCDKDFKTPDKLRRHISTVHTNERPFQCSQCGEYFKTQEILKNHAVVHSKQRPFQCIQCEKSFKRFADLKEHEKTL